MSFASPSFDLNEESLDAQTHLIAVRGEVHVSTAPEFSERLNDAIARRQDRRRHRHDAVSTSSTRPA